MSRHTAIVNILRALIALCPVVACSPGHNDFCEYTQLPRQGWAYGDTLRFAIEKTDAPAALRPIIALRHNTSYPYANLWLEVTRLTTDHRQWRDTIEIRLCDIYGQWIGNGFGDSYQRADTLRRLPPMKSTDTLLVRHVMRVDTLRGIEQMGVFFVNK